MQIRIETLCKYKHGQRKAASQESVPITKCSYEGLWINTPLCLLCNLAPGIIALGMNLSTAIFSTIVY